MGVIDSPAVRSDSLLLHMVQAVSNLICTVPQVGCHKVWYVVFKASPLSAGSRACDKTVSAVPPDARLPPFRVCCYHELLGFASGSLSLLGTLSETHIHECPCSGRVRYPAHAEGAPLG